MQGSRSPTNPPGITPASTPVEIPDRFGVFVQFGFVQRARFQSKMAGLLRPTAEDGRPSSRRCHGIEPIALWPGALADQEDQIFWPVSTGEFHRDSKYPATHPQFDIACRTFERRFVRGTQQAWDTVQNLLGPSRRLPWTSTERMIGDTTRVHQINRPSGRSVTLATTRKIDPTLSSVGCPLARWRRQGGPPDCKVVEGKSRV